MTLKASESSFNVVTAVQQYKLKLRLADAWKILYHTNSAVRDESNLLWCVSVSEELNRPKCVREKESEPWQKKEVCVLPSLPQMI